MSDFPLTYTLIEVGNLLEPWAAVRTYRPWKPGLTLADAATLTTIPGPVQVTRNGVDPDQFTAHSSLLTQYIAPGDTVYLWPEIHPPLIAAIPPAVMAAIKLAVTVISIVMTVVSVIQGLMQSTPDANRAGSEQSPAYGFDGVNPSREGFPAPVYYGDTLITPVKLGEYLTTDDKSDQTYHGLFAVGQGVADGVVVAADILINDEPLASYKNYTIASTVGDNAPVSGVFPNFTEVHQYRSFARPLEAAKAGLETLLHCNGLDGAVLITDETALHTWTCQADAALSTTDPFLGSACLDCQAAGDYVSTASPVYAWDKSGTIEFRACVADLAARGFLGGEFRDKNFLDLLGFWGLAYESGQLLLQVVDSVYDYETGTRSFASVCSISAAATLSPGTWHHFCVQKDGLSVRLYLDGVSLGTATCYAVDWDAMLPTFTLGRCMRLVTGVDVVWDGLCKIDEVRVCTGTLAYTWAGFTPPAAELADAEFDTAETLTTLNACDSCYIVLGALRGLYQMSDDGSINTFEVAFDVSYRRVGDVPWTTEEVLLTDHSTQEVRRQYGLTFPARAQYEIQVERTTPANDSSRTQNETSWIGIDEILDEELLYPNMQVLELNIKADERLRGNVPLVKVVGHRTSITVPNYNGVGTQAVDAANPAWVAYDILTNDLYGAAVSPLTRIDAISHDEWLDWCDGLVATYKRARFNGVFDTEGNIQQALRYVYDVGRVSEITLGQKIAWAIEKPGAVKHHFSIGNTEPKSHSLQFMPRTERVDVVIIEYNDKDKRWKRKSVSIPSSTFTTLSVPARTQKIFLRGCNNEEQARREGILKMQMTELLDRSVSFRAGLEAVTCLPGHICSFQHAGNRLFFGGRVRSLSGTSVILDRVISLAAADFEDNARIWIRTCEDVLLSADILGPWDTGTNTFTLSSALAGVNADYPDSMDPYMLGRYTNEVYQYRILEVSPPGQDLKSEIKALEYNETVYYHSDYEAGEVAI